MTPPITEPASAPLAAPRPCWLRLRLTSSFARSMRRTVTFRRPPPVSIVTEPSSSATTVPIRRFDMGEAVVTRTRTPPLAVMTFLLRVVKPGARAPGDRLAAEGQGSSPEVRWLLEAHPGRVRSASLAVGAEPTARRADARQSDLHRDGFVDVRQV